MVRLIDEEVALGYAERFINELTKSGYVKDCTSKRMMIYLFLVDFIETLYENFGEEEYKLIEHLMIKLFGSENCLLQYPVFCTNVVKLGAPRYVGGNTLRRQMMSGEILKRLEVEQLRSI